MKILRSTPLMFKSAIMLLYLVTGGLSSLSAQIQAQPGDNDNDDDDDDDYKLMTMTMTR